MGIAKELLQIIEDRGYGVSDKCVCSGCIRDEYLIKIIRNNGKKGTCSFCTDKNGRHVRHRIVYRLDSLLEYMMPAIDYYYMDADGNVPRDEETKEYDGVVIDHFEFVNSVLASELQTDNVELLNELYDVLENKQRTSIYEYIDRTSKRHLRAWAKYTQLVKNRANREDGKNMSVEQIVSLCANKDAPEDLKEIHSVLQDVLTHAQKMNAYSVIYPSTPIYRVVNFHDYGYIPDGYKAIPATMIGTAPASVSESGRFNEKGDMMFYGASNPRIAMKEVGEKKNYPFTIGEFHTDKRITVLNLCTVADWKRPSFFSIDSNDIEKRESWFFLNEYIKRISQPVDRKQADSYYKPIQVFTKYMQRVSGLYGVEYRSSKESQSDNPNYLTEKCYVLFAENRDCLDESEKKWKYNPKRLQLFMRKEWQSDSTEAASNNKRN